MNFFQFGLGLGPYDPIHLQAVITLKLLDG
jgi:hypothetical protein